MIRSIVKDAFFLLSANADRCVGMARNMIGAGKRPVCGCRPSTGIFLFFEWRIRI